MKQIGLVFLACLYASVLLADITLIAGTSSSGKSSLSLALKKRMRNSQVISADPFFDEHYLEEARRLGYQGTLAHDEKPSFYLQKHLSDKAFTALENDISNKFVAYILKVATKKHVIVDATVSSTFIAQLSRHLAHTVWVYASPKVVADRLAYRNEHQDKERPVGIVAIIEQWVRMYGRVSLPEYGKNMVVFGIQETMLMTRLAVEQNEKLTMAEETLVLQESGRELRRKYLERTLSNLANKWKFNQEDVNRDTTIQLYPQLPFDIFVDTTETSAEAAADEVWAKIQERHAQKPQERGCKRRLPPEEEIDLRCDESLSDGYDDNEIIRQSARRVNTTS